MQCDRITYLKQAGTNMLSFSLRKYLQCMTKKIVSGFWQIVFSRLCFDNNDDLHGNYYFRLQLRGLERRSLHYFPYRDDGYLLYYTIQKAARDYVMQ